MPKLKNSNATFWVIFKHCGIVQVAKTNTMVYRERSLNGFAYIVKPIDCYKSSKCIVYVIAFVVALQPYNQLPPQYIPESSSAKE